MSSMLSFLSGSQTEASESKPGVQALSSVCQAMELRMDHEGGFIEDVMRHMIQHQSCWQYALSNGEVIVLKLWIMRSKMSFCKPLLQLKGVEASEVEKLWTEVFYMAGEISKISLRSDTVEAKMGYVMSTQKEAKHWNESVSYVLECEVTCEKKLGRSFVRQWLSSKRERWVPQRFYLSSLLEYAEASLVRAKNSEVKVNEAYETIKLC